MHDVLFDEHYIIFFEKNLEFTGIVCIFAARNKTDTIMLGIESPRKPITGQFAKELREALVRARTGNLNQSEKESVLRSEKVLRKYNAVWK
jgi:carotenoid cleavage dioxygenase-like enzyme